MYFIIITIIIIYDYATYECSQTSYMVGDALKQKKHRNVNDMHMLQWLSAISGIIICILLFISD